MIDEIGGPPDKPLPREPPPQTETSTSSSPANSTAVANNLHENSSDSISVPNEITSDGENSLQTCSPPSSPDV